MSPCILPPEGCIFFASFADQREIDKPRGLANLHRMRFLLLALLSLCCISCASTPKQDLRSVTIQEIKPRYIKEESFKRIGEYFTGAEKPGRRVFLRSDAPARAGYYFTLILDEDIRRLPSGTTVLAEFYTGASPDVQTHTFTLPNRRPKTREIFVGLTGTDWPDEDAVPAAWRFTFVDPNGQPLGSAQSYLWSM